MNRFKTVVFWVGFLAMIGSAIYVGFIYRFNHPEKTETQSLIDNWPFILAIIAGFAGIHYGQPKEN